MAIQRSSLAYIAILAGIAALPPLSIDMNLPAIPDIEAAFQVAPGQGSLTFSLFLLGFSVAPMLGGPVCDRYGRRPTLLVALFANILAAFACTLGFSFSLLLVSRLVQGTACGVCVLVPLAMLRDTYSGSGARKKLSAIMFVGGVAPLVAPILGSGVLLFWGWPVIYGVQGGLSLVLFICILFGIEETLPQRPRNSVNAATILRGYKSIFTSPRFLGFALTQAFCFGCLFSYIAGSPGFMLGQLHLSEQHYSLVFALTSLGVMAGSCASGILGRREIPARRIISMGLGLMTIATGVISILLWRESTQLLVLVPLLFLVMSCFGLIQPNAMSEAVAPWSNMAGAASGALTCLQMLVGAAVSALSPVLAGLMAPGKAMSLSMLGAALCATTCALLLGRTGSDSGLQGRASAPNRTRLEEAVVTTNES